MQPKRSFKSLAIRDLLDAREAYHVHLAHLDNVIATAIGLYRIRQEDADASDQLPHKNWRHRSDSPPRTLENTIVQPWSWPCVLVFVNRWQTQQELVEADPDQVVPRYLYLPDGRVVPTCVILAEEIQQASPPLRDIAFSRDLLGGGYPILTDIQGREHIGSIGCLLTDGNQIYALTNQHVCGDSGTPVYTVVDGQRASIGKASHHQIGKLPFKAVYPDWSATSSHINIDAGLIRIDDVKSWTAQIFGLGELGRPIDLTPETITLDIIGWPVRAFGAASGFMQGEIQALFYRYHSVGGTDYISDLLIGSRSGQSPLQTIPGDSGTIWCLDSSLEQPKPDTIPILRPLGLQWGGHVFQQDHSRSQFRFALATSLSTVLRELDVDLVPNWHTGHRQYWGEVGHYKIGGSACDLVQSPNLKALMSKNRDSIAFGDHALITGNSHVHGHGQFTPLADVADLVWRTSRPQDSANHFADVDQEGMGEFSGKTLLDLCQDSQNLDIATWNAFYDSLDMGEKRGSLLFRVWQLYNLMVAALKEEDVARFVCTAGVLAHYVGDGSQPLHASFLHDGHPDNSAEKGVHSAYETKLLDRFTEELITGVNQKLSSVILNPPFTGGKQAAIACMNLMRRSWSELPPETIIEAYVSSAHSADRLAEMWQKLGDTTQQLLANGVQCLASIWESAWQEGNGEQVIAKSDLKEIPTKTLQDLYTDPNFAPSYRLQDERFAQALEPATASATARSHS
ncbi:hypothetical protein [Ktedonospora formicarum]|uniref:Nal1 C-terminal domain-containing protein n=1 Tax=Ktedonospora formicarum TaxID=2778364 RepID=A0A8J3MV90_9CHLR|nr:hypothetical protein [Ktedonospora formicarum]GHO46265.1 hypothetical protein KSX_44280 [Ktedonospora formicarum]